MRGGLAEPVWRAFPAAAATYAPVRCARLSTIARGRMADEGRGGRRLLGAGVTIVALGAGAAHLIWPALKIDAITVLLLVVALLPWLGGLLESLELPGGYKLKYRALADKVEQTEQRATEAISAANVAIGAAAVGAKTAQLDSLVAEYTRLRMLPPGPDRTQLLDQWFGVMTTVVSRIDGFDVGAALGDDDIVQRLAAYAHLFAQPNPDQVPALVDAITHESTSFTQYWAIRTLRQIVRRFPAALTGQQRAALTGFLADLPDGSRKTQLAAVLIAPHQ